MPAKSLREVSEAMTAAAKLRAMCGGRINAGRGAIHLNAEQAEALIYLVNAVAEHLAWVHASNAPRNIERTFAAFERTLGEKP